MKRKGKANHSFNLFDLLLPYKNYGGIGIYDDKKDNGVYYVRLHVYVNNMYGKHKNG